MTADSYNELDDELKAEYDFANMQGGVRGNYAGQCYPGAKLIMLDPDVAATFPNAHAVN